MRPQPTGVRSWVAFRVGWWKSGGGGAVRRAQRGVRGDLPVGVELFGRVAVHRAVEHGRRLLVAVAQRVIGREQVPAGGLGLLDDFRAGGQLLCSWAAGIAVEQKIT